jgi:hypothetical protein
MSWTPTPGDIVALGIGLVVLILSYGFSWKPKPYPMPKRVEPALLAALFISIAARSYLPGPATSALAGVVSAAWLVFFKRKWFGRGPGLFAFFRDDTHT